MYMCVCVCVCLCVCVCVCVCLFHVFLLTDLVNPCEIWHSGRGSWEDVNEAILHQLAKGGRYSNPLKCQTLNGHISCPVCGRDMKLCTEMSLLMRNTFASRTQNFHLY